MKYKKYIIIGFALVSSFWTLSASAAVLSFGLDKNVIAVDDQLIVEVRIDSEGAGINVAQATVTFPKALLQVIKVDRGDAAFNFWLSEPTFSNDNGTVNFLGGSTNGLTGQSLKVLTITFKAKGIGQADLAFTDAAVTASDGSGANLLSGTKGSGISISEQRPAEVIAPPQISRTPEPSKNLPGIPKITVPLYPDPLIWSNVSGEFLAKWVLPADISEVAAAVDQNKTTEPVVSDGLFDHKTFSALRDGIWYLHVRFKNNVGWGATAHYRIAIDRAPPKPFTVAVDPGLTTDNPTPVLQFKTSDALSGIKEYQILIGDGDAIKLPAADFRGVFTLPLQEPGKRSIFIKAVDQAGNSVTNNLSLEILPIASPTITFITSELFSDEERELTVQGRALPYTNVLLKIYRQDLFVADGLTKADDKGYWEFIFNQPLRNGNYIIRAQSQDTRGALSLITESKIINVKSKPIITIGVVQLGKGGAILLLLFILVAGFVSGIWFYKKRQSKLELRINFAESEVAKIFRLLKSDVDEIRKSAQTPTTGDDDYTFKRFEENIKKMEEYLKRGVEKIKR